jgi:hypothetical protein
VAAGIAAVAGAVAGAVALTGGGGKSGSGTDAARLRADVARKLPAGWTDTVDVSGGKVTINLVHRGDIPDLIRAMRADPVVDLDRPEMLTLLPADRQDTEYVFALSDTQGDGTLLRAAAGKGHHSGHPDLQFASRTFLSAELAELPHTPQTPLVIGPAPAN